MATENKSFGLTIIMLVVTALVIIGLLNWVNSAIKGGPADMSETAVAERIGPVGQLNTGEPIVAKAPAPAPAPTQAAAGPRSGEAVFNTACTTCHATGAAGAPKVGDNAAWGPRIAKGMDTLLDHAVNGFNAMPAKGLCMDCSSDELKAAIEYMVERSQ